MSAPQVTWCGARRAEVDDHDGRHWWVAPDGVGYSATCNDPFVVRRFESVEAALRTLIGDAAGAYLGGGR